MASCSPVLAPLEPPRAHRAAVERHIHFHRRVSARIKNLARLNVLNFGHGKFFRSRCLNSRPIINSRLRGESRRGSFAFNETSAKAGRTRSAEHHSARIIGVSGEAMLRAPVHSGLLPRSLKRIAARGSLLQTACRATSILITTFIPITIHQANNEPFEIQPEFVVRDFIFIVRFPAARPNRRPILSSPLHWVTKPIGAG